MKEVSHLEWQSTTDIPKGLHVYQTGILVNSLNEEIFSLIKAHFDNVPSPLTGVVIEPLGGKIKAVPRDECAISWRDANYAVGTSPWSPLSLSFYFLNPALAIKRPLCSSS